MRGRAESAPTLDSVEAYTEEWEESMGGSEEEVLSSSSQKIVRKVTFQKTVKVRAIPAEGKGIELNKESRKLGRWLVIRPTQKK